MKQYVVGVDLGGTNVRVVLVDEQGQASPVKKEPTQGQQGPAGVIGQISRLVQALTEEAKLESRQVKGMGLGLPGVIDSVKGQAIILPNLPGWQDIPVAELVWESLGLDVYCENDVRLAAWGEKLLGAAQESSDVICLNLGTGIGSGIFLGGKLWRGWLGSAGEVGHMTVEKDGPLCTCGNKGCLEMFASGRGIARRASLAVQGREDSRIYQIVQGRGEQISAATVLQAAGEGDSLALELIRQTAEYLGLGLANLANILNPQLIILGGGVTEGWGYHLLEPVRKVVQERAMSLNRRVVIEKAQLGDGAGVLGAAQLARRKYLDGQNLRELYW